MPSVKNPPTNKNEKITKKYKDEVISDFKFAYQSRMMSLLGRKEVLTGKAKFGIFGGGKEIPQVALAKVFQKGDFRSGYYRDQTWMMAAGMVKVKELFAQLYADVSLKNEPHSSGRQMNAHFANQLYDSETGELYDRKKEKFYTHTSQKNTSSDISSTAAQMPRAVGLALASKKYRENPKIDPKENFSKNGNEVCFASIGDASTSEGHFWESINAAGVMQIPLAVSIWDDGYGISVPTKYQTTKGSIYEVLQGFKSDKEKEGYDIYQCNAWDYEGLIKMYKDGIAKVRDTHKPAIFHIKGCTQPQGHSTSGSHERYKSKERLEWEKEHDCIAKMEEWMVSKKIISKKELEAKKEAIKNQVIQDKNEAWADFQDPIVAEQNEVLDFYKKIEEEVENKSVVQESIKLLSRKKTLFREDIMRSIKHLLIELRHEKNSPNLQKLTEWRSKKRHSIIKEYKRFLYSESDKSSLKINEIKPTYPDNPKLETGYNILNQFFDHTLKNNPKFFAFGEDVGQIGDVNQGFAGMQEKHGEKRVFDTGIRETTIIGQGIGMAVRGLKPLAEIQYLDYFIYGMQPIVDDLATLQYRTYGRQKAPLIIRTRGHRLEGIWHTGSPIGMILNGIRGVLLLVPRDMTRAAGFYNTLLQSDDPAVVIECLNGYRLREPMPNNLTEFTVPIGVPEVLNEGTDVTLVTYGSCVRVAQEAIKRLQDVGISVELIDVQSLLPFDINSDIVKSLKKTNRLVIMDEDVPGGATAYILQKIMEEQEGYRYLDSQPTTLTSTENRSPYGNDGGYYTKPSEEDVFEVIYKMMNEVNPNQYPMFF